MLLQVFHICQCYLVPSIQTATNEVLHWSNHVVVAHRLRHIPRPNMKVCVLGNQLSNHVVVCRQTAPHPAPQHEGVCAG